MKKYIIPLESKRFCAKKICGGKAAALSCLLNKGFKVPTGFCISVEAYFYFIAITGLKDLLVDELTRKEYHDMRWEEMWDSSLRIRNMFLRTEMPKDLTAEISESIKQCLPNKLVAIRSSSIAEDSNEFSFAGIHESFVKIRGIEDIIKHIKLVWASLWSDKALAYKREIGLDIDKSAMGVVVQEMIQGEKSGVAFGVNPQNSGQAVIESVCGLNKGLVDGEVEPDRWFLDRNNGFVIDRKTSESSDNSKTCEKKEGFDSEIPGFNCKKVTLNANEVTQVFEALKKIEEIFGSPQDVEWTYMKGKLYILQARPITTVRKEDKNDRRTFDLSLRRTFDNLKSLGTKIEKELVPQMEREIADLQKIRLEKISDEELQKEMELRKGAFQKWSNVYWEDFIPFAHAIRLFGEVYNNRIAPEDPYEFIHILMDSGMESVRRNTFLAELSEKIKNNGQDYLENGIDYFIENFGLAVSGAENLEEKRRIFISLIDKFPEASKLKIKNNGKKSSALEKRFLQSFSKTEKDFAGELISLAKKSYRFRDDDNIYLGRIEEQLNRGIAESRRRLGKRCYNEKVCNSYEEIMRASRQKGYVPQEDSSADNKPVNLESQKGRIRGQGASGGIARGKAHIVKKMSDIFEVEKGAILVCDSIDPNITFIIPLVRAIVERRGGMLVHGAIIAREYGLPCVTGIPGATDFIKTGNDITVDGYNGFVTNHTLLDKSF